MRSLMLMFSLASALAIACATQDSPFARELYPEIEAPYRPALPDGASCGSGWISDVVFDEDGEAWVLGWARDARVDLFAGAHLVASTALGGSYAVDEAANRSCNATGPHTFKIPLPRALAAKVAEVTAYAVAEDETRRSLGRYTTQGLPSRDTRPAYLPVPVLEPDSRAVLLATPAERVTDGSDPDTIVEDIRGTINLLHARSPETKILLLALLPQSHWREMAPCSGAYSPSAAALRALFAKDGINAQLARRYGETNALGFSRYDPRVKFVDLSRESALLVEGKTGFHVNEARFIRGGDADAPCRSARRSIHFTTPNAEAADDLQRRIGQLLQAMKSKP